jgi:tRNA(Ile)-lysidine synthetase-like protein
MNLYNNCDFDLNLDKSKKYLLACSCGPDSMALFWMLKTQGYSFDVAFVNYKTRTNSDSEEETIIKFCTENNIKLYKTICEHLDDKDFENQARIYRYNFFRVIMASDKQYALLTAHHADDSIETYYFHKERKSLSKYEGIVEISTFSDIKIIRPLLCVEKKTLLDYCIKNNLPYSIDYTNFENDHTRNRIRHEIVEKMSASEKEKVLFEIEQYNNNLQKIYDEYNEFKLNQELKLTVIKKMDEDSALHLLYFICEKYSEEVLSGKLINEILKDIKAGRKNIFYSLSAEFFATIEYETFRIISINSTQQRLNLSLTEARDVLGLNVLKLDDERAYKVISLCDCVSFKVNGRKKSPNRYMIDCKIPESIRGLWPCVVDRYGEVLYTPRYRYDYVSKEDQVFTFTVEGLLNFANK